MQTRREFISNLVKFSGGLALMNSNLFATNKPQIPSVNLNNGVKMPILGYGTYDLSDTTKCVLDALSVGYRLIDTAQMYGNEEEVGEALRISKVPLHELFITTKLSQNMSYKETLKSINIALKKLKLEYIDLLLIHGAYSDSKQMYKAMEELYENGVLRAIGISNFTTKKYVDFVKDVKITPMINQMETHVFFMQKELRAVMKDTRLEAWRPFANGKNGYFSNLVLDGIAKKHGKNIAQIGLRYLIQNGIIAIPKTTKKSRMIENIDIFDFSLDDEDLTKISHLDTNKSLFGWY